MSTVTPSHVGDQLMTVDKRGKRLWVYADIVEGVWRKRRFRVSLFLLTLYLIVPWLEWKNLPLLQFDIFNHKIYAFGNILDFSETFVFITFLLGFAFSIIAFTSLAGRVWCGWACPQTVFLDFLFRPIEKWIEGRPSERKKLDESPRKVKVIFKKSLKWMLYAFASFVIANTFVAYLTGRTALISMMINSPSENLGLFCVMLLVFAAFMFNFGWFREQMCTLACPYGRLQSVLLDKDSYVISYNESRGEPRGKKMGGDCVDCNRCVQVCPTGIDIRNGLQLECISCAACIDACNFVMSKLNRASNLIGYTTERRKMANTPTRRSLIRPFLYGALATLFFYLSIQNSFFRDQFTVLELKNKSLTIQDDGEAIRNEIGFLVKNQTSDVLTIQINTSSAAKLFIGQNPFVLHPGQTHETHVFIQLPKKAFKNGIANTAIFFQTPKQQKSVNVVLIGSEAPTK